MKKIKTGIYGLSPLLYGGFVENSSVVVIGRAGAGKTTFATQFIRRGLEVGQEAVFVSLDENREQIIKEAVAMGWVDIQDYIDDEKLFFIDASGRDFANFIREELANYVAQWADRANMRVAIDPLTPVLWTAKDLYEQRELLLFMLKEMRRIGTVVCTLEEHGSGQELAGAETVVPTYLADCVIHLNYRLEPAGTSRFLRVIKYRGSRHSDAPYPYAIVKGFGLVVRSENFNPDDSRGSVSKIENQLLAKYPSFPPALKKRLQSAFSSLIDKDIKEFPGDKLLTFIAEEYETDETNE